MTLKFIAEYIMGAFLCGGGVAAIVTGVQMILKASP